VFEVVELVDDPADLIGRENAHLCAASNLYNTSPAAGSTLGAKYGPMPESHRAKIAAAKLGKKASDEARKNLSEARKGRGLTPEWRAKIAASMTGKKLAPLTAEHRARISAVHAGKTISEAHRQRLSEAHKGKKQSPEFVAKRIAAMVATKARKKAEAGH
jgi:hypothetical protein